MFVMSDHQINAFTRKAESDFVDRMVDYTRTNFPQKFHKFGEDAIRSHAESKLIEARQCGFETERQIVSYLDLGLRYGRFNTAPWAQESLRPETGTASARMRKLQEAALRATGRIR